MFESIINNSIAGTLSIDTALICMAASIVFGLVVAFVHSLSGKYSKNFIITIAMLPILIQVVMMMVNGNLGTGIAIVGAFSLIRFRSMPGTSRELVSVFFSMAIGLAIGMGHILFALIFTIITSVVLIILTKTKYGEKYENKKMLKITIPEDLNYVDIFNDIMDKYTKEHQLLKIKTTNMGSMYELTYSIRLKDENLGKEFIDKLRTRNGNLNIALNHASIIEGEL